jgi:predicted TIM-barrel fold metal-dependent hydrolase
MPVAEELDIPVAIHMGTCGSERANVMMPKFRGSMIEELLACHPKLRVQVMHAGYPMIDNTLTLLHANSHVLRRRCGTDLELTRQESQSLYRATCGCRIR